MAGKSELRRLLRELKESVPAPTYVSGWDVLLGHCPMPDDPEKIDPRHRQMVAEVLAVAAEWETTHPTTNPVELEMRRVLDSPLTDERDDQCPN